MGTHMGFSRSSFSEGAAQATVNVVVRHEHVVKKRNNPDPKNFRIEHYQTVGKHLVLEVVYPDCENYEGRKILLFERTTLKDLKRQGAIDPHFSDNKKKRSPVARFEPTGRGWQWALAVAKLLR